MFLAWGAHHSQAVIPDWLPIYRAAQALRVPPWEIVKQPVAWTEWALILQQADHEAAEIRQKRNGK